MFVAGRQDGKRSAWAGGRPITLQIHTADRRKNEVFGKMRVTKMFEMSKLEAVDEAVAKLLEFAEYPKGKWCQEPFYFRLWAERGE
jgi:hypothetical protein